MDIVNVFFGLVPQYLHHIMLKQVDHYEFLEQRSTLYVSYVAFTSEGSRKHISMGRICSRRTVVLAFEENESSN